MYITVPDILLKDIVSLFNVWQRLEILPIDIILEVHKHEKERSHSKYVEQWKQRMKESFQKAVTNTDKPLRLGKKNHKDKRD